mmetsp:Transcript_24399/g.44127  ORF Transcript_24399/g.44127 Transcript_24399/m.44127 type:complete len:496 (-) Transcript_24399:144-1631(-)
MAKNNKRTKPGSSSSSRNKKMKFNHKNAKQKKPYKKQRLWIEHCKSPPQDKKGDQHDMSIVITGVHLTDSCLPIITTTPNSTDAPLPQAKSDDETKDEKVTDDGATTHDTEEAVPSPTICQDDSTKVVAPTEGTPNEESAPSSNQSTTAVPNSTSDPKEPKQPFITVIRSESSNVKVPHNPDWKDDYKPLPNGDCGDGVVNPFDSKEVADKYWAQRRRLFTKFDDGIQLDKESWYSVTPEVIANHIANRMSHILTNHSKEPRNDFVVLDAFCGCGGNAIAFAKQQNVSLVICIDTDRTKLKKAANNALLYQIPPEKLVFVEGDSTLVMSRFYKNGKRTEQWNDTTKVIDNPISTELNGYKMGGCELLPEHLDAVFLSPPWGGMNYGQAGKGGYDLKANVKVDSSSEEKEPKSGSTVVDGEELLLMAANAAKNKQVVYFLPRNINGFPLGRAALKAGYQGHIEMEANVVNGKLKTVTTYLSTDCDLPTQMAVKPDV